METADTDSNASPIGAAAGLELETPLRLALARTELEIHFQPQVALATRRIVGVEAFARWQHKDHGWIPATSFIPVAEETNLIHPLGEFALARACRQVREWDRAGLPSLRAAVKVSAQQFRGNALVRTVATTLRTTALAPERLELEIRESVLAADEDRAIRVLSDLKAIGVTIAVDDFGVNYPDLSYLWRLPVDCLKLDRSLVHRAATERVDSVMAQAIIALAHSLEIRVVAEGVELPAELDSLLAQRCDEAQGLLFCAPLAGDAMAPVMASWQESIAAKVPQWDERLTENP